MVIGLVGLFAKAGLAREPSSLKDDTGELGISVLTVTS